MRYTKQCKRDGCTVRFHYCTNCGFDLYTYPLSEGYCSEECMRQDGKVIWWEEDEDGKS